MLKFKIAVDSSADLIDLNDVPISVAPIKVITDRKEYIKDSKNEVEEMVNELHKYKGRSSTACPSPEDWLRAFGDAEYVFCITITGTLSGSYNSASVAKELYEEMYPNRKVFVFNSLSTGPELKLIVEKITELISLDYDFSEICREVEEYKKQTGLVFMLESIRNLANNGRVSPLVSRAVGMLGIRIIGKASDVGDLQIIDKCRGEDKAIDAIIKSLRSMGLRNGKVRIAHCFNETAACKLQEKFKAEFQNIKTEIYRCGALCSFYAEKGGLLVGFEKF